MKQNTLNALPDFPHLYLYTKLTKLIKLLTNFFFRKNTTQIHIQKKITRNLHKNEYAQNTQKIIHAKYKIETQKSIRRN